MNTTTANYAGQVHAKEISRTEQVVSILRWTYGLVPIIAGVDKFTHALTNWNQYLAPAVANMFSLQPNTFMNIVGIIEIIAGIVVLVRPKIGSMIVSIWLAGIVINLLLTGKYFDIAVRDTVMAIGAFCLFILLSDWKFDIRTKQP